MRRRIEHAEQGVHGDGAGVVVGFLDLGEHLAAPRRDLVGRQRRRADHRRDDRQDVPEILGQAGGADHHLRAAGRRGERSAPALDVLGDGLGVERLGAAVEDPCGQGGGAGAGLGIGVGARRDTDGKRHRGDQPVRLDDDGDAVGQDLAQGLQGHGQRPPAGTESPLRSAGVGSKTPMVRLSAAKHAPATRCTSSRVTASSRGRASTQSCQRPMVAK